MSQQIVVGTIELVDFKDYKINNIPAKIDTGAYTGALHCTKIGVDDSTDVAVLHFSPFDNPEIIIKTKDFSTKNVKSSNGEVSKRYFIETKLVLQGKEFMIQLSLANRSDMKWPILIGRRFLMANNILVDVSKPLPLSLTKIEQEDI